MRLGLAIVVLLASGCGAAGAEAGSGATDDFIDMDTPPLQCSAGTSAEPCPNPDTEGAPEGGPCVDSDDCASGGSCLAPYVDGNLGDFTCTAQCIPMMDEVTWCLDASACCDEGAVCSSRGLCVLEVMADDSGTGTDTATAGSDTSDTGTSSGTSTDSSGTGTSGTGTSTGTAG